MVAYLPQPRSLIVPRRSFRKPARPVLDPNDPINRGLVGCWLLGYNTLGISPDLSIYGNNGTIITGSIPLGPSHHGGLSATFDGTSFNLVSIPNSPSINLTQFSICAWAYLRSYGSSGQNYIRGIASKYNTASGNEYVLRVGADGTSGNANKLTLAAASQIHDTTTFGLNTWQFCVGTNISITANLYRNTVNVASGSIAASAGTDPLYIGTDFKSIAGDNRVWNGFIDCVRLYNRVITVSEQSRLYVEPYAGILAAGPRWRVGTVAAGFTAVNRRTLGPRVGSRSVY